MLLLSLANSWNLHTIWINGLILQSFPSIPVWVILLKPATKNYNLTEHMSGKIKATLTLTLFSNTKILTLCNTAI